MNRIHSFLALLVLAILPLEHIVAQSRFTPNDQAEARAKQLNTLLGRVTTLEKSGGGGGTAGVSSVNTRTGAITIISGDVTSALGFTPATASHTHAFTDVVSIPTGSLIYRKTAGTGAAETQTLATLKSDLGLTGTNSGDQTITLTGNVTGSGTGSFATTIAAGAVTLANHATLAANSVIGNNTGVAATPIALSQAQLTALVNPFTSSLSGAAPASGGGTTNFLRADGTWAAPATGGTGTVTSVSVTTANGVSGTVATATSTPAITLSLGAITPSSVAAVGTVAGSNLSGTNTGDQTITLTSDVTGSGTGSFATTIGANKITYSKFQQVAASSLLGNSTGVAANAQEITLAGGLTFSSTTLSLGAITPTSVTASGSIKSSAASGGIGYQTGAGGTITQATSKSTGVTLNTMCGSITVNAAALAATTTVTFTVTNSQVAATDGVVVTMKSGNATAGTYQVWPEAIAAGSFKINVRNMSAGSLSEAITLTFVIIKGVTA